MRKIIENNINNNEQNEEMQRLIQDNNHLRNTSEKLDMLLKDAQTQIEQLNQVKEAKQT